MLRHHNEVWLSLVALSLPAAGGGRRGSEKAPRSKSPAISGTARVSCVAAPVIKKLKNKKQVLRHHNEVWLSLVERCVRDAEAAGSSPVTSTIIKGRQNLPSFFVLSDRCALPFSLAYRERFGPLSFLCGNCHIFSKHSKKTCAFLNFIYNY